MLITAHENQQVAPNELTGLSLVFKSTKAVFAMRESEM